ncbi:UNVERIFIED_CONTAM: hypothetical protein K2H54_046788 [Gekko kuhli]
MQGEVRPVPPVRAEGAADEAEVFLAKAEHGRKPGRGLQRFRTVLSEHLTRRKTPATCQDPSPTAVRTLMKRLCSAGQNPLLQKKKKELSFGVVEYPGPKGPRMSRADGGCVAFVKPRLTSWS